MLIVYSKVANKFLLLYLHVFVYKSCLRLFGKEDLGFLYDQCMLSSGLNISYSFTRNSRICSAQKLFCREQAKHTVTFDLSCLSLSLLFDDVFH